MYNLYIYWRQSAVCAAAPTTTPRGGSTLTTRLPVAPACRRRYSDNEIRHPAPLAALLYLPDGVNAVRINGMVSMTKSDRLSVSSLCMVRVQYIFSDQFWTICTEFGKSATNFDIPAAESCSNGRRTAEPPKLTALFPKCMHCRLHWPEKV